MWHDMQMRIVEFHLPAPEASMQALYILEHCQVPFTPRLRNSFAKVLSPSLQPCSASVQPLLSLCYGSVKALLRLLRLC